MTITDQLFEAFLQCPTKCFLRAKGETPTGNVYSDWVRGQSESYRSAAATRLGERFSAIEPPSGSLDLADSISTDWRYALGVRARSINLESHIHAVERIPRQSAVSAVQWVPIRFVRANRPNNVDKLMLAFDAYVLSKTIGCQVAFGRIIHGDNQTFVRFKTGVLTEQARKVIERIGKLLRTKCPPDLVLNRHCAECEFQAGCRQKAISIDDLSLLSGMKPEERVRYRRKGIFTVNQLSYTFRPRRQSKRESPLEKPHYSALKALAIRENTVYVHGSPRLPDPETSVYLDIEGLSTSGPYYLLGVLIVLAGGRDEFHSFWADLRTDETAAFSEFVEVVSQLSNFHVFHYGAYDAAALKLIRPKLPDRLRPKIDMILERSVNVLTVVHRHIYFPTYTNGLKDLGQFLGCERTTDIPSGLQSMIWRKSWEMDAHPATKETLLRYNKEDCLSLRRLCEFIRALAVPNAGPVVAGVETARTDTITPEEKFRVSFGSKKFALRDLEYVNKCAYFDYQREKVLFRTHPHLKARPKTSSRIDPNKLRPNTTVLIQARPCPKCGSKRIESTKLVNYFLVDLKFTMAGIKKFITKFSSWRCRCLKCDFPFSTGDPTGNPIKFGRSLQVWCTYWSVVRGLQLERIRRSLEDLFGISIHTGYLCRFRQALSHEYRPLYEDLLKNILRSPVLHIDETLVHLQDKTGYVWVLTSLDMVCFLYKPNREGGFLAELLRPFSGVLVSDFYGAYDSLACPQQKCLVHFVRDIDDDLLKNPLDEELKAMAQEFATLLKQAIESVDHFGLKKRHLIKHKKTVEKFLTSVQSRELTSPVANSYKQRFQKSGAKMFTFLEYDGVPWNNNHAEHAIKRFAKYRRVFDGYFTEDSLNEYLILASVLNTCEFNNLNVLKFLLSEEKSLNGLQNLARTRSKNLRMVKSAVPNTEISELQVEACTNPPEITSGNELISQVSCTDARWKELCRTHLRARQKIRLTDFNADADREWCHNQARRYGARLNVRKRPRYAILTFAHPI